MTAIMLAIAPVFVLILMGYGLRRGGIPSTEFWNLNDKLVYWVLIPALFFVKISAADLGRDHIGLYAGLLYGGFFGAVLVAVLLTRSMRPAKATSVIQGSARFNTFVALAIAQSLFEQEGLQIAVLGGALLVPVVNVTVVTLMTRALGGSLAQVVKGLATNPLILSILAGAFVNLAGYRDIPVLHETARILGNAALPVMLLCVGANLHLRGLGGSVGPVVIASFGKLVVFPALVLAGIVMMRPDPLVAQVAMIFAALPTGVASYTLARQMGGDAPLMARIITAQTLLSFATLPLSVALVQRVMGY